LKLTLPKVYPITDTDLSGLSHLEQVRRLIDGGATLIQLRYNKAPSGEFYVAAAVVMSFARPRGVKIIINDRVDISLAAGADGVHLGQDDLPPKHARKLLGENAIIGISTHSIDQAREALALPVDYIAVGPIFATATKADHEPLIGIDGLLEFRTGIGDFPLVAIGGINRENAAFVLAAGANSVAVIHDMVSKADQIANRMRELTDLANSVGNS
jgi:thiamine-phosphate pyrophosphorylase